MIAVGLLLVAVADPGARFGAPWAGPSSGSAWPWPSAPPPPAWRAEAPGRSERLLLVLLLGMGLYLVKVLHSPLGFTFHDEFLHWRTADDIATSGRLYGGEPPAPGERPLPRPGDRHRRPDQPGRPLPLRGRDLPSSGRAGLLMLVALFLLFESVSRSARVAGWPACSTWPTPTSSSSGPSIPTSRWPCPWPPWPSWPPGAGPAAGGPAEGVAWALAFCGALWATVMTHHLTAYALAGFLVLWLLACPGVPGGPRASGGRRWSPPRPPRWGWGPAWAGSSARGRRPSATWPRCSAAGGRPGRLDRRPDAAAPLRATSPGSAPPLGATAGLRRRGPDPARAPLRAAPDLAPPPRRGHGGGPGSGGAGLSGDPRPAPHRARGRDLQPLLRVPLRGRRLRPGPRRRRALAAPAAVAGGPSRRGWNCSAGPWPPSSSPAG